MKSNDITLESLLLSITSDSLKEAVLDKLKNTGLLERNEKELITEYEILCEELGKLPTPSILVNRNLQYKDKIIITKEDDVIQYTQLFINNRLKQVAGSNILNYIQSLNNGEMKASDVVNNIVNEANKLNMVDENDKIKITTTDDFLDIYNKTDVSNRYRTGLEPIDNLCEGIPDGSVTVIMGGTGSFKTMTTTNICYNAMIKGKNICYLSLEVSKMHMYSNIISRHSMCGKYSKGLFHKKIKNKELTKEEYSIMESIDEDLRSQPGAFTIIDETDIKTFDIAGFQEIISQVDKNFIEKKGHGVDILVVDHAQLLKFSGNSRMNDPYLIVNYYISWFRQQSLNFLGQGRPISVIIVSQASRQGIEYANKHSGTYLLSHVAEANEIERSASYVISVFADDNSRSSNELYVQLLKSRNSETMTEALPIKINPAYYVIGDNALERVKFTSVEDNVNPYLNGVDFSSLI